MKYKKVETKIVANIEPKFSHETWNQMGQLLEKEGERGRTGEPKTAATIHVMPYTQISLFAIFVLLFSNARLT